MNNELTVYIVFTSLAIIGLIIFAVQEYKIISFRKLQRKVYMEQAKEEELEKRVSIWFKRMHKRNLNNIELAKKFDMYLLRLRDLSVEDKNYMKEMFMNKLHSTSEPESKEIQ